MPAQLQLCSSLHCVCGKLPTPGSGLSLQIPEGADGGWGHPGRGCKWGGGGSGALHLTHSAPPLRGRPTGILPEQGRRAAPQSQGYNTPTSRCLPVNARTISPSPRTVTPPCAASLDCDKPSTPSSQLNDTPRLLCLIPVTAPHPVEPSFFAMSYSPGQMPTTPSCVFPAFPYSHHCQVPPAVFPLISPDICHTETLSPRCPQPAPLLPWAHLSILPGCCCRFVLLNKYSIPVLGRHLYFFGARAPYHLIPVNLVLCPGLYLHFAFPFPASLRLRDGMCPPPSETSLLSRGDLDGHSNRLYCTV